MVFFILLSLRCCYHYPHGVMAAPNMSALNIRRQVPELLLFFGTSKQIPD
jgi:hypothetical protein